MNEALTWRQLAFAAPIEPDRARGVLLGIATMPGHPRIVLEARAQAGRIQWRIGCSDAAMARVRAVLRAQLPEVRLVRRKSDDDRNTLVAAASVHVPRSRMLPLRSEPAAIDQVTRQLFDVLATTARSDQVRIQLILGVRTTPKRAPVIDGVRRVVVEGKFGQYGFGCSLRIGADAGHVARARMLVEGVAAAFRVLEVPGLSLTLRSQRRGQMHLAKSPLLWPLWLSVEDLASLMAWPVTPHVDIDLPGMPPRHPRLMPATSSHPREGRPMGRAAGSDRLVGQPMDDALRHTHVLGLNGTGKSTLLGHLVLDDLRAGRGAVLIDPKGDLVDDLLDRIPKERRGDIVLLDARHPRPAGINPLVGRDPDLAADSVLTVFHELFADSWGPRTSDILHASVLTLARRGDASLLMVPLLLTNPGFRRSIIQNQAASDPLGLGTFWATFEAWSDAERAQAIQPLMNKLRTVLLRPALRNIFGQRRPAFDLADVFSDQKLLLVALGKGVIGVEAARLLGSLVTTQLWHAVLARGSEPQRDRQPVNVYIDEVQDYVSGIGDLDDALATARGFGVGFTVAHQELGQLGRHKGAVLANARSRVIFQPSPADARELATLFGDGDLTRDDFRALGAFQAYGQLLVENTLTPWVSIQTRPWGKASGKAAAIRRASTGRYGADLDEVERDLFDLIRTRPDAPRTTEDTSGDPSTPRPTEAPQDASGMPQGNTAASSSGETFGRRRRRTDNNTTPDTKGGTHDEHQ